MFLRAVVARSQGWGKAGLWQQGGVEAGAGT